MLLYAIIFISCALLFYTIGVWSEKIQGVLKKWHLIMFGFGLIFDTLGTYLMKQLANASALETTSSSFFHGVTGLAAIILMLFHAIWAFYVLRNQNEKQLKNFHKFSLIVWIIWLIPFLSGGMSNM